MQEIPQTSDNSIILRDTTQRGRGCSVASLGRTVVYMTSVVTRRSAAAAGGGR